MTTETLETNAHGTTGELERLEKAYQIIQRRDGAAERRAFQWRMFAYALVAALVGLGIWDHLDRREALQGFVQVVQVNDEGEVVKVGVPQDLMAYEPSDGQYLDMLAEWVRQVQWRGSDKVATQFNWNWARAHLCGGPVKRLMDAHEKHVKPFENVGKKLTSIEITHATRTPVPQTYHLLWNEITSEASVETVHPWMGTFTVSRLKPATQAVLLMNHLGLCISAFSLSPVHLGD
jgi:type IV secretory pathway TrbF-like protein